MVINFTGGETWGTSLRCVKRGGKILVCGATAGLDPEEDLRYIWTFELQIIGCNSFYDDDLAALMAMIEAAEVPVHGRCCRWMKRSKGCALIRDREVLGKVVVTP